MARQQQRTVIRAALEKCPTGIQGLDGIMEGDLPRGRLDAMGGRMEIDSAPGKGSRFTLRVPLKPDAAERPRAAPP